MKFSFKKPSIDAISFTSAQHVQRARSVFGRIDGVAWKKKKIANEASSAGQNNASHLLVLTAKQRTLDFIDFISIVHVLARGLVRLRRSKKLNQNSSTVSFSTILIARIVLAAIAVAEFYEFWRYKGAKLWELVISY